MKCQAPLESEGVTGLSRRHIHMLFITRGLESGLWPWLRKGRSAPSGLQPHTGLSSPP